MRRVAQQCFCKLSLSAKCYRGNAWRQQSSVGRPPDASGLAAPDQPGGLGYWKEKIVKKRIEDSFHDLIEQTAVRLDKQTEQAPVKMSDRKGVFAATPVQVSALSSQRWIPLAHRSQ